ncbi:MAG TPA: C40 family peptidase [Candidatus Lustribacter sp.]|nr:C40 family peptidase [Candidatus Lustribacter sp.]
MALLLVDVLVTTMWTSPDAPRGVDALAVAAVPDPPGWLAALDRHPGDDESGDGRLGLHGRVETQLLAGEPFLVSEERGSWAYGAAPWQPTSKDPRGYPGWVPRAHLRPTAAAAPDPPSTTGIAVEALLAHARRHVGLAYLWGGRSELGLDCSGLVHLSCRELGLIVPRDAHDQHAACRPVALGHVQAGDLYFFAHPGRRAHHVGIVTAPGVMLHAPETGQQVIEEPLSEDRRRTLVAAGRLPLLATDR